MTDADLANAEQEYKAASTDHAAKQARWEELRGPIAPITDTVAPALSKEQVDAMMAAHEAAERLITALHTLFRARGFAD